LFCFVLVLFLFFFFVFFFCLTVKGSPSQDPAGPRVNVTGCLVEHNAASFGGGILMFRSHVRIRNTIFRNNEASFQGGAILAIGRQYGGSRAASIIDVQLCTFQNDSAGRGYVGLLDGSGFPVLQAEYNARVLWGPNTYLNLTNDASRVAGVAMRLWNGELVLVPADGLPEGSEFGGDHVPSTLCVEGCTTDTTRVRNAHFSELKFASFASTSLQSRLAIGRYDVSVGIAAFRGPMVTSQGGRFISTQELWLTRENAGSIIFNTTIAVEKSAFLYPKCVSGVFLFFLFFCFVLFFFF
jgi:hypothetical protein